MSSFYSDASLVLIPSGYKNQKVYSAVPTDGSGDLSFTRASSATRVASNGLIEKVRTNNILQSEAFNEAAWDNTNEVTITANAGVSPNGTNTADRFLSTGSGWFFSQLISLTSGIPYTISVYVKSNTASSQTFRLFGNSSTSSSDLTATTSWQRFTFTFTASSGSLAQGITRDGSNSAVDLLVWGAQLETGDIATDYIATTTAAVSVGPVSGLPRLDYLGSTCPRLLLEPQRTNLVTFSEQFDNAGWGKSQSGTGLVPVVTANNAISPDGYQNADTIVFDVGAGTTSSDISAMFQTFGGTTATYTGSFYAKTASGTAQIQVRIDGSNYDKFTITNQWQRFTLTKALTGTSNVFEMAIRRGLNEPMNATATIQLWGVQVELGAYATSYIPTLSASVTRVADVASKTGISSLIGQTEGTLFVDFTINGLADYGTPISVNDGSTANYIWLTIFANGTLRAELFNGAAQASITFFGPVVVGRYKMAFGYKTNDFVLYVNGALVGTDLTGTTFSGTTLSRVDTNLTNASVYSLASESINQALIFKTRLTNAQLAELTA